MMKKYSKYLGMALLSFGVTIMAAGFVLGWTAHNWVTISCLLLIVVGVVVHVAMMKCESRY